MDGHAELGRQCRITKTSVTHACCAPPGQGVGVVLHGLVHTSLLTLFWDVANTKGSWAFCAGLELHTGLKAPCAVQITQCMVLGCWLAVQVCSEPCGPCSVGQLLP